MNEATGSKAIGTMASDVTDEPGALARTVSRIGELREICETQMVSLQQAQNWFAILDTVLGYELDLLNSIGKGIAESVPNAVYSPLEG